MLDFKLLIAQVGVILIVARLVGWLFCAQSYPFPITYEGTTVSTDLGAEKVTESEGQRIAIEIIAVEVKDFDSRSLVSEFEKALGQYRLYRALLKRNEPERMIFLAVREEVYNTFFQLPAIQAVVGDDEVRFIVFDQQREEVIQWVK